jgi:plastocyanin
MSLRELRWRGYDATVHKCFLLGSAGAALCISGFLACSSDSTGTTGGADASSEASVTPTDAGGDRVEPTPEAGVDSGPQFKACTDAALAAATLATNGSDISFFTAGIDGGALEYSNNCVRIPQGKDVGWYGDFTMHPLASNGEPGSPIPSVTSGNDSGRITFPNKGKFSFHCTAHPTTMFGTVQVE